MSQKDINSQVTQVRTLAGFDPKIASQEAQDIVFAWIRKQARGPGRLAEEARLLLQLEAPIIPFDKAKP